MPTLTFAEIADGAVFGDGKEGIYRKVPPFQAPPQGFRSRPEANAWELDSRTMQPAAPAWFAEDCDELVCPLPGRTLNGNTAAG